MKKITISFAPIILASFLITKTLFAQENLHKLTENELSALVNDYYELHYKPELSGHEEQTSAFIAMKLRALGYEVTQNIGKFSGRPWKGYGVVGMLKNGEGPTLLIRTEMDALPVQEKTGLSFASTLKVKNDAGEEVGVSHACGHDIHMSIFLGVAENLMKLRSSWKGIVLLIGQPAEEGGPGGSGAEAMLNDGLYTRFPKPDYTLGLHQIPALLTGKVGYIEGYTNAVSAGGEIIIKGVGTHPARPQDGKDPIILAAQIILALQTIQSREVSPTDPFTLTIGAIHGGVAENVMPDEVRLRLTFRAMSEEVFDKALVSLTRIVNGLAKAAGMPDDKMPVINVKKAYPANYNDPKLAEQMGRVFRNTLGAENVEQLKPIMTGEDFSYYSLNKKIPNFYFAIGSTDSVRFAESLKTGLPLPDNHSPYMIPVPGTTIRTGVIAMTAAAMALLKPEYTKSQKL